jgi:hypothetical protein
MKKFLVVLAAFLSLSAFADRVFVQDKDNLAVLKDTPCVLEMFKTFSRFNELKAAELTIDGLVYQACYLEERGLLVIVDENADQYGPFSAEIFVQK